MSKIDDNKTVSINFFEDEIEKHYALLLPETTTKPGLDLFTQKKIAFGQFALLNQVDDSTYEAIRDPLGIEKLFYTETSNGELYFSKHFTDLIQHKSKIFSVPKGTHVRIQKHGVRRLIKKVVPVDQIYSGKTNTDQSIPKAYSEDRGLDLFKSRLTSRLSSAFTLIKDLEDRGWKIFVALSGGLDSTTIANFSKKFLVNPIACTVDLGSSEDAKQATLIAKQIGLKHLVFGTTEDEIKAELELSPSLCQDFRDFNVHCAVLNSILARNIRSWSENNYSKTDKLIVLTGDLMNEYTCDYSEEIIDGTKYYRLPRIGKKKLQEHLVGGLDTSDRELSPFGAQNIFCIQPYAILYDLYLSIGEDILSLSDSKNYLNSFFMPKEILENIPKSKLRAQVGSKENMGVLGLCHRMGIKDQYYIDKLLSSSGGSKENIPILMGRYDIERFET